MKRYSRLAALLWAWAGSLAAQTPTPSPSSSPSPQDLAAWKRLFEAQCGRCHGLDGSGGLGPSLKRPRLRRAPDDKTLVTLILDGIPGTAMGGAGALVEPEAIKLAAYVRSLGRSPEEALAGDPTRGRTAYERNGCAQCHIVKGEGGSRGPELSEIGAQRGARYLREALTDPAAALPERLLPYEPGRAFAWLSVRAVTREGRELEGVRVNEDTFTIQIRDAEGVLHSLRKAELGRLDKRIGTSVMPSFKDALAPAELEDLVAYLASLRGEP